MLCFLLFLWIPLAAGCQLTSDFYATTCPTVQSVVSSAVQTAVQANSRMAASLLRLHFHDCFVNGCDGSVLLDGASGEKFAIPNNGSLRGFDVVDDIKAAVENACNATVSCADILALAARDSVLLAGGPSWTVLLGRRDSTTANQSGANSALPAPFDSLSTIESKFRAVGLTNQDVAVLSGAHTIGCSRCRSFVTRLYNFSGTGQPDPTIDSAFLQKLQSACPQGGDPNALVPLDRGSKNTFDNNYYLNLQKSRGLLRSDQELVSTSGGADTVSYVNTFASDQGTFFTNFMASIISMGNISPLTGTDGEIRLNCRVANS